MPQEASNSSSHSRSSHQAPGKRADNKQSHRGGNEIVRLRGHAGPIEPTSTPTALHNSPSGRVSFQLPSNSFTCPAKSFQELLESLRVKTKLNLAPSPGLHAGPRRTPRACPPLRAHVLPCRRPRGRPGSSPSRPSPAPLRPCSCLQLLPSTAQQPPCQLPSQPSSTAERLHCPCLPASWPLPL